MQYSQVQYVQVDCPQRGEQLCYRGSPKGVRGPDTCGFCSMGILQQEDESLELLVANYWAYFGEFQSMRGNSDVTLE